MNPILNLQVSKAASPVPGLTFNTFVVGASNCDACFAAKSAANNSGQHGTFLILCGGSGLGKTHLLNAIHAELLEHDPTAAIKHLNADDFTSHLIHSIHTGTRDQFRAECQTAAVFLLDDVQFLAGKPRTQEELLLILETRYQTNRCTVITLGSPVEEFEAVARSLRTRFPNAVLATITEPDYEVRTDIVRTKATNLDLNLSEEEIDLIAQQVPGSLRNIHGVLNRINLYRSFPEAFSDAPSIPEIVRSVSE